VFNRQKQKLGEIPLVNGLYSLKSSATRRLFAGVTKQGEPLTMEEVHVWLGHITPNSICQMIRDGLITGVMLDEAHTTMGTCNSCEYAKLMRKLIWKI